MKAEDLRIGNLVSIDKSETVHMVISITHPRMKEVSRLVEDDLILLNPTTDHIFEMNILVDDEQRVFGIDLTKEWLLNFGFKKEKDILGLSDTWWKKGFGLNHIIDNRFSVKTPYKTQDVLLVHEVHELQNLFFSLNKEELCLEA